VLPLMALTWVALARVCWLGVREPTIATRPARDQEPARTAAGADQVAAPA
jgi:hypothetical protein